VAAEDSNEKRRRELEEILELRRSFGTLGRRLVKRETPIRSGVGPSVVELLAQPPKTAPDARARPEKNQWPEPELDQQPEPDRKEQPEPHEEPELHEELDHEAELDQEPDEEVEPEQEREPDRQPESDQQEEPVQEPEPQAEVDQPEPQSELDQELDQQPESSPDQQAEPEPVQEPDEDPELDDVLDREVDRVSAAVGRPAPVVDERYRGQAPPAPADASFRIPEPPAARRPPWPWLVALVVVFALGMAVDHAVLAPAPRPAAPASTQAAAAPTAPTTSAAPAPPRASVPRSCLSTAVLGDRLVDLLVKKTRGIQVTRILKEYTQASQSCRKEASP
jgi:hypothetical protein